jgi:D-glycero-D-manno-heptose 1,7-bisphosphate phosphatase
MHENRAIIMDRDGTISEEVGYLNNIDRFKLIPRAGEAINLINNMGFKAIVITNQSGVGRGYFPETLVHEVHNKLRTLLKDFNAYVDAIYYCPHHPDVKCRCRKPNIGLLERAIEEFDIDPSRSYVIGDKVTDVDFAERAKSLGIIVKTGYGRGEIIYRLNKKPLYIAEDIYDAVKWIMRREGIRIGL